MLRLAHYLRVLGFHITLRFPDNMYVSTTNKMNDGWLKLLRFWLICVLLFSQTYFI